jgi:hypothetical protein
MDQKDIDRLDDDQIVTLERMTQKLADETQRQAARYQRTADRLRKAIKRRKDAR